MATAALRLTGNVVFNQGNGRVQMEQVGFPAHVISSGRLDSARLPADPQIFGNLTPVANLTYDLGSAEYRWKDLWLSGAVTGGDLNASALTTGIVPAARFGANVAIGEFAGLTGQGSSAVAIGASAGANVQSINAVAIGVNAGSNTQGSNAVAIGREAGETSQGAGTTAMGWLAGQDSQGPSSTAVGYGAGQTSQGSSSVAVGRQSGLTAQGNLAVAIGFLAGSNVQGDEAISIGHQAGRSNQGTNAVAIGSSAGQTSQGQNVTAVGVRAGRTSQGISAVAIGADAGANVQSVNAVAVGSLAGSNVQGCNSVAVGREAGQTSQGVFSTAVGFSAGKTLQGNSAVAIGTVAGSNTQGSCAVAIGSDAGQTNQGQNAVAIGFFAGYSSQASNSIVINASGAVLNNTTANSCVIKPVRAIAGDRAVLFYNSSTGEISTSEQTTTKQMGYSNHALIITTDVIGWVSAFAHNSASQNTPVLVSACRRSANSAFSLFQGLSGNNTDNAFVDLEFNLRGDGNGYCDGAWTGGGADYAEYFESATGDAIPVGTTVVLDDNRVRPAIAGTDAASAIVGVVRPKGMAKGSVTIGNSAWNHWNQKYLTDDYGSYVMEPHEVMEWTEVKREYESTKIPEGVQVPTDGSAVTETRSRTEFSTVEYLVWTDENGVDFEYVKTEVPEDVVVPEDARTDFRTVETTISYDVVSWTETTIDPDAEGEKRSYESWNVPADVVVPANAVRKTHDDKGNPFVHKKPNPQYDPTAEYVPRENRDEWVVVGLLGQIPVTKGQTVGERWTKMHDVSPNVEMWFVR